MYPGQLNSISNNSALLCMRAIKCAGQFLSILQTTYKHVADDFLAC